VNKIAIIGIIIAVIIGIGAASSIIGNSENESKNSQSEQIPIIEEIIPVETEPEQKGKNISLELTESIGLTSP
jgi:hypothetical protein